MGRVFITEGVRTCSDGNGYSCEDDDERADSWDVVDSASGAKYFGSEDYSTATRVSCVLNAICREHAAEVARLNEQVRALAAENAALKNGNGYFSYGSEHNFEWHKTAKEAADAAEAAIDDYRGDACDGWSEEVDSICWGVVIQSSTKVGERPRNEDDRCDPAIETICDYALLPSVETPATDAILREMSALAVDKAAQELKDLSKRSRNEAPIASEHTHAAALYLMTIAAAIRAGEVQP